MVPVLANELAAQITAGVGNFTRLAELSMVPRLAKEVAAQIASPSGAVVFRLTELSMAPGLAKEVVSQIQGGGVLPPDYSQTFDQAISSGYNMVEDFAFGTTPNPAAAVQIGDTTSLAGYFNYFAGNLATPTSTINSEYQRYVDFSNAGNFAFASDALELTATLPNGSPVGTTSTTISGAVAYSRSVTVADASQISAGQVVSLGANAYANLHVSVSIGVRGTITAGNSATVTVDLSRIGQANRVFTANITGASTFQTIGQDFVDQINADTVLQSLNIIAWKQPVNPGSFVVVYPKYQSGGAPPFGYNANGSLQWAFVTTAVSGTILVDNRQSLTNTFVVSKSGNVLTLNHPITAANGDTLNIMVSRMMMRTTTYAAGETVLPIGDSTGITVGQAIMFGPQDNDLRRVTAVTSTTITMNTTIFFVDGAYAVSYPMWFAVTSATTSGSTVLSFAAVPASVRVGQQMMAYAINPDNNRKVTAINRGTTPQTVTMDGNVTIPISTALIFYEPIQSAQIWSKWHVMPGELSRDWVALELTADFPDASAFAAWPAFWLYKDPNSPTGFTAPTPSGPEVDMTDLFVYFNNISSDSHRPQTSGTATTLYQAPAHNGSYVTGNNVGIQTRKIQMIWSVNKVYFYIDGILMYVRAFNYNWIARPQIACNLAVGSGTTAFNANGFFPLDFTKFPMKYRLKRLRVLTSPGNAPITG